MRDGAPGRMALHDVAAAKDAARIDPGTVAGKVAAPPSKSVTHRALLLAAQGDGIRVTHALRSADTAATLRALAAMGARFTMSGGADGAVDVAFQPARLHAPTAPLDCGNSGTTLRLLAATAARLASPVVLTGDASLRSRPQTELADALRARGVACTLQGATSTTAPVTVRGPMRSGPSVAAASGGSQPASALLLSLPFLRGDSTLHVAAPIASLPYLEVTRRVAAEAGIRLGWQLAGEGAKRRLDAHVPGDQAPTARAIHVEGDWSSAAFPLAAAAVTGGSVEVTGLDPGSAQGDRRIVDLLASFGVPVAVRGTSVVVAHGTGAPRGGAAAGLVSPGRIDAGDTPDLVPVLAVLAACATGTTELAGAAHLRHKESDRIHALATGLRRMGCRVQERPDGMTITGGPLQGTALTSGGDHRIHMALCVAALAAQGPSLVDGTASAAVSYPGFHAHLQGLGAAVHVGDAAAGERA